MKKLWINHYSVNKNEEYIIKLMKLFKIKNYNFTYNRYGEMDIHLTYNAIEYRLEINEDDESLFLYKKIIKRKGQKHPKTYSKLIKKFKDDVWYKSLKYISEEI